jgi:TPR repeat protein
MATQENIQEAIRLHEAGEYVKSTAMFGRLADPNGPNNPLSQVLYGLALRHGWGIETDLAKALTYLRAAAKNSAEVEQEALRAGMTKGGSAKGELVLAMYEVCTLPYDLHPFLIWSGQSSRDSRRGNS